MRQQKTIMICKNNREDQDRMEKSKTNAGPEKLDNPPNGYLWSMLAQQPKWTTDTYKERVMVEMWIFQQ